MERRAAGEGAGVGVIPVSRRHRPRTRTIRSCRPDDLDAPAMRGVTRGKLLRRDFPRHRRFDHCGVWRLSVEFQLFDLGGALLDLPGRGEDVFNVLIGLAEMSLQLANAVAEQSDILHDMPDLGA